MSCVHGMFRLYHNLFSAVHGLDELFQEYKCPVFMGCLDYTVIFYSEVHDLDEQFLEYKCPLFMGCLDCAIIFFSAVNGLDEQF